MISDEDKVLFRKSIGTVRRSLAHNTVKPKAQKRPPVLRAQEQVTNAPEDRLSDEYQPVATSYGDELNFTREGLQNRTIQKLRRGKIPIESELDLHGLTVREAKTELLHFLDYCQIKQLRCIRIIHGKGHGSRDRQPIIKKSVANWLVQCEEVRAYCSAKQRDGGTGALYVLLSAL